MRTVLFCVALLGRRIDVRERQIWEPYKKNVSLTINKMCTLLLEALMQMYYGSMRVDEEIRPPWTSAE